MSLSISFTCSLVLLMTGNIFSLSLALVSWMSGLERMSCISSGLLADSFFTSLGLSYTLSASGGRGKGTHDQQIKRKLEVWIEPCGAYCGCKQLYSGGRRVWWLRRAQSERRDVTRLTTARQARQICVFSRKTRASFVRRARLGRVV